MEKSISLEHARHSLAHLLAAAVGELHPDALRAIGPATDNGFYYDFEFQKPISSDDVPAIEAKMQELLPTWATFEREEVFPDDAKKRFADNVYKLELIDEITERGEPITLYTSTPSDSRPAFSDLCRGGHSEDMSTIDPHSFTLSHIAGAYWRGNEKNTMLTRIYGLAFGSRDELDAYIEQQEEAKKRDHKKLGRELDLFTFSELVGPGLPLWTPRGTAMREELDEFVWQLRKERDYERVEIPHITKKDLYEKSGHWDKFADELFKITTREEHEFAMKPMNCPHHTQIYTRKPWSYRELPQRYANTTMCYRDEQTGELSGLSRVRAFTQDDAHVFCRHADVKTECLKIWDIVETFYGACNFKLSPRLSLHDPEHPEKYLGEQAAWRAAEEQLRALVKERGAVATEAIGEAAFYGPKIDFMAYDSLGRQWQLATIQLDMNLPERFDLTCTNESGEKERIVMIHAAIMGSIERFLSIYIEHTAGAFPLWLAPEHIRIIPIGEAHRENASGMFAALKNAGIRATLDDSNESLGKRIREAKLFKVPYIAVIGDKEIENGTVTLEKRDGDKIEVSLEQLQEQLCEEIARRK